MYVMLVKLTYYAPGNAHNFWNFCSSHQNYPTHFLSKIKPDKKQRITPFRATVYQISKHPGLILHQFQLWSAST